MDTGERKRRSQRGSAFNRLWAAQTISQFGSQITVVALPLLAVVGLDATPLQTGLLGFFQFLPFLLFGLPAGVIVDRMRRRPILIVCDVGRALVLGVVPLAHVLDVLTFPLLCAVALLSGLFTVFFDISYQAYLPSLVSREELVERNSQLEVSRSLAQLTGPGLGGLLVRFLGAPMAILADALTYAASTVFLWRIRNPEPDRSPTTPRRSMLADIRVGLTYIRDHTLLRPIALTTATANLALGGLMQSTFVLYAVRTLEMSTAAVGWTFAVGNSGAVIAALVAPRLRGVIRPGLLIVGAAGLTGVGTLVLGLATPATGFVVLAGGLSVVSFGSLVYNINQVSLRQSVTPFDLQGRMNASMRFLVWGTLPIGALLVGVVAQQAGVRASVWCVALVTCLSVLPVLLSPVRALTRFPSTEPEE